MQALWNMQGMLAHTLGVVGGAATGVICYAMLLIIRVQPWWHAQYFIPTLGMILGNCISGVSVGLSSVMEELTTGGSASSYSTMKEVLLSVSYLQRHMLT